jgi:hypothetical protein
MGNTNRRTFLQAIGSLPAAAVPTTVASQATAAANDRWWESAAASVPVFIRPRPGEGTVFPLVPASAASKRLDEMRNAGVSAIEVYAPAEGGNSFLGLDTINRYRFEPRAGTMDDFKRLVELTHKKGMKIISIDNLGYSSVEAVDFLKACDDVKAGRDTREARFYVWSNSADAPPPAPAVRDPYFITATTKGEFWQYSERAGKYYWTKWSGVDLSGKKARLPQYNWGGPEFREESEKIIRFWMDTGLDGMLIDAVNWYVGCNWRANRRYMTDVISSYGNKFSQPETSSASRKARALFGTIRFRGSRKAAGPAYRITDWRSSGRRAATSSRMLSKAATRARSSSPCAIIMTAWSKPAARSTSTLRGSKTPANRISPWRSPPRRGSWCASPR